MRGQADACLPLTPALSRRGQRGQEEPATPLVGRGEFARALECHHLAVADEFAFSGLDAQQADAALFALVSLAELDIGTVCLRGRLVCFIFKGYSIAGDVYFAAFCHDEFSAPDGGDQALAG